MPQLDSTLQQPIRDILMDGKADETKCIAGKIKMSWDSSNTGKAEYQVSIPSPMGTGQPDSAFRIRFELGKANLEQLKMSPSDEFRLSLRGANLEKLPQIPKLCTYPMKLVFSKGVHIQWKRPGEQLQVLNTWMDDLEASGGQADSWFSSQKVAQIEIPAKLPHDRPDQLDEPLQNKTPDVKAQTKRKLREDAKQQRKKAKLAVDSPPEFRSSILQLKQSKTAELPAVQHSVSTMHSVTTPQPSKPDSDNILKLRAGLSSSTGSYMPINNVKPNISVNLIGVVTEISSPRQTQSGDFSRFVGLVDPSNYTPLALGTKVNCFQKTSIEWLPQAQSGDILIMRAVKTQDKRWVGYHDSLRWATFSPTKGMIRHDPQNDAPQEVALDAGGSGVKFSPFYQPGEEEIDYCAKLSDWWRAVQQRDNPQSSTDSGAPIKVPFGRRVQRVHRLISEAGPFKEPDGYFDCTVEVLRCYTGDNTSNVYSVYVTDYTRNEGLHPLQSSWLPTSLSEMVLQMELWDNASQLAFTMEAGQYYSIKNARMRINGSGHMEGKAVEAEKITQLKEEDAANDLHLKALLERKKEWQNKASPSEPELRFQVFEHVEELKFFNVIAELLYRDVKNSCIYVTDYTSNPRFAFANVAESWARDHENCVIQVFLYGEQKGTMDSLEVGSFYCLRRMRLKRSETRGVFCSQLGGQERLIVPVNPKNMGNPHLNGLLRRKEHWELNGHPAQPLPGAEYPIHESSPLPGSPDVEAPSSSTCIRIKDISEHDPSRMQIRIRARPVDFHPLHLADAFYQFCTRCKKDVPSERQACLDCSDFDHEYIRYMYQLYVRIEDEDGNQIIFSINDKCNLLEGLKRTYLPRDPQALSAYRARLAPLLGNLPMMHDALKSGKKIEPSVPLATFELDSWIVPEGRRAFSLLSHNT